MKTTEPANPLLITEQAHSAIARAVRLGQEKQIELGGSLLAVEANGTTLIAYALPTGPCADQGWGHIRTDAAFQNRVIAAIHARWQNLVYVGDWHVHPMWLPELSSTDRRTARMILREDAQSRDHLILLLGTSMPGKSPVVLGFKAAILGAELSVESMAIQRVADASDEVTSRLGRALPPLDDVINGGEPEISTSKHAEIRHVASEIEQIQAELGAEATLWLTEDALGLLVQRGEQRAVVLFPPEYPLGAPQVFSGSPEDGPLRPIPLLYGWSSLHHVVDLVAQALEGDGVTRTGEDLPPRPIQRRRSSRLLRAVTTFAGALCRGMCSASGAPRTEREGQ